MNCKTKKIELYKNRDYLYQKYIIEQLPIREIAKICLCGYTAIRNWLKKYGIKIRSLSDLNKGVSNPNYRTLEERLWEKIDKKDNISECWTCTGYKNKTGHGRIKEENNGKFRGLHVVTYEIFYKDKVKKGEVVHHMCKNPSCCNPFHLVKMKTKEHNRLHNNKENNNMAKLTMSDILFIKKEYCGEWGEQTKLAKKYNVSPTMIHNIVNNKSWKQ